jgi:uncharacterized protein YbjT (DUF2867 family)
MPVFPSSRIVVFGATGKVGQRLIQHLSELGRQTLGVALGSTNSL